MRITNLYNFPLLRPQVTSSNHQTDNIRRPHNTLYTNINNTNNISFTGLIPHPPKRINLSKILREARGEIYRIKLFNKAERSEANAFLTFEDIAKDELLGANLQDEKALKIYSEKGEILGFVNINSTDWQTASQTKFDDGLSIPFLRLHDLEAQGNKKYAGIGSNLIQAAVEKSIQYGQGGRIYVEATNPDFYVKNDPFIFYNKMGLSLLHPDGQKPDLTPYMRKAVSSYDRDMNNGLLERIERLEYEDNLSVDEKCRAIYEAIATSTGQDLDKIYLNFYDWMYLYDTKVHNIWEPRIRENPLFSESKRIK